MIDSFATTLDYKRKIKTPDELAAILGPFPRQTKVVMCHGTFDIVHPGHVRHLMYAKERGGILVASLTCDAHINKANFRPIVPEALRAMNLAAIEVVDYVIIDSNPTPIENIKKLKPDLFAKGFDYVQSGIPPRTQEEMNTLESYGGELIFTPGDIVYSSSAIIESTPPKLGYTKLKLLMESEGVTFDQLRRALEKFRNHSLHVLGDTIVDSYTQCSVLNGLTKSPTIDVQVTGKTNFSGGAAVVAKHLRATGASVTLTTVLGDDDLKDFVLSDLEKHSITCNALIEKSRPTTNKTAFIAQGYHMLRVSRVDNRVISYRTLQFVCDSVKKTAVDGFICSDFRHGIFNKTTIPKIISAIPENTYRVADSQVASRWGNILEFKDFDLITPNEREIRFALGDQHSVIRHLALELYNQARCKLLILKLGERGILTYRTNPPANTGFFVLDAFADRVVDAVGAGDALMSYATLSMLATKSEVIASILGSFAAAIAVEHEGNNPVTPEQISSKIDSVEEHLRFA